MAGLIYYTLDLETTGLAWKGNFHEICEFSIIRNSDRCQLTENVRVNKIENASIDALRIIKKTAADLKKGISKKDLIEKVEKFLSEDGLTPEHRCLVGHNIINFDRKFLWQLWSSFNKTFPFVLFLDTMHLMRTYVKEKNIGKVSLALQSACDLLNIKKVAGQHNALSDTRNTYLLLEELIKNVDYIKHIKRMPHNEDE